MKTIISLFVALPVLAACGGGGSDAPVTAPNDALGFNPTGQVVNACESNYYRELTGDYDAQISYTDETGDLSCTWEVELQVNGEYILDPVERRLCDLTMNMASTSTNPEGCSDVGIAGDITEPLKSLFTTADELTNPIYPVEATTVLNARLPNSAVHPVGETGEVLAISLVFDGRGNASFPSSLNTDPAFTGVLVKQ